MKRIFWHLIFAVIILQGCSTNDEDWELSSSDKLNFPLHIEKFGKAVANEIHQTVKNLNEKGVNYSNASNTSEFKKQFFQDWIQANPEMKKTKTNIHQMFGDEQTFVDGLRNLTNVQIKFINRILKASSQTTSYDDFDDRLAAINKDIYNQVSEIEQERLLYITSVLYFSIKEIQSLEKQGQMLITPQNKFQTTRIKTRSESGGGFWGTCREFISSVAVGVIGEMTKTGEIIVSISKVMVGGVAMIMTVLCVSDSDPRPSCTKKYTECMSSDNKYSRPNSNGWGDTLCSACLSACIGNGGIWNCN